MPRPLVWFRRDLRVDDNTALLAAASLADDGLVALYVLSPGEWRSHDDAPAKIDFWLRNLACLSGSLAALHVALLIETADAPSDIPAVVRSVARRHGCTEVHANREYEVDESRRDVTVRASLGMPLHLHDDRVLLPPGSVRTQSGTAYTVFTPFKRQWLTVLTGALPTPRPAPNPLRPITDIRSSAVPSVIDGFSSPIDAALSPPPLRRRPSTPSRAHSALSLPRRGGDLPSPLSRRRDVGQPGTRLGQRRTVVRRSPSSAGGTSTPT